MTEPTPNESPSWISPTDAAAIVRSMSRMPYAANSHVPIPQTRSITGRREVTPDDVVAFLDGLAGVLRQHGDACRERDEQLHDLRRDLDAVRRVFGSGR